MVTQKTIKAIGLCILVSSLLSLSGCSTPKIEPGAFHTPKSVLIADFPDIHPIATIRVVYKYRPEDYFNGRTDGYYVVNGAAPLQPATPSSAANINQAVASQISQSPRPVSVGTGVAAGLAGGLVGALIDASAEETQKKAAEFPNLVKKSIQGDFRVDFLDALRHSLEAKGVEVNITSETRNSQVRLIWPTKNTDSTAPGGGQIPDAPAPGADLFVQVAPIALFAAPGPLNSYAREVGVGVAIFDGRTRKFLGWQAFPFKANDSKFQYLTYESLVADVSNAGPALRETLLSLVPQVVGVVSGGAR
ncbi:MAG: hypothetical protein U1E77_10420 [Inhella sp.]